MFTFLFSLEPWSKTKTVKDETLIFMYIFFVLTKVLEKTEKSTFSINFLTGRYGS